jgi:hypothetical protein
MFPEGQVTAAAKGTHGGRPKVIDDDSLLFARALEDKGVPRPGNREEAHIKTGKNAGKSPSVASLYRALAEADERDAQAEAEIIWTAPPRTREDRRGLAAAPPPELMERLERQVLGPRDMSRSDCQLPCPDLSSEWLAAFGGHPSGGQRPPGSQTSVSRLTARRRLSTGLALRHQACR